MASAERRHRVVVHGSPLDGSSFTGQGVRRYAGITTTSFVDPEELPDGVPFTYVVKAIFTDADGGEGTASNQASVVARNDPPTAASNSYTTLQDGVLTVQASGVLVNDTDSDSSGALIRVTGSPVTPPANGTLTGGIVNADGSFTYTPARGYSGTDSFTYKAKDDRTWPVVPLETSQDAKPMSPESAPGTVTITITKKKK